MSRDAPPFEMPPFGDGDLEYAYVGSLGPLPTGTEFLDGAVEVDVHTRDSGMVDLVMWSEKGVDDSPQEVLECLQLTPSDARCLAALLIKAAGSRPGRRAQSVTNN